MKNIANRQLPITTMWKEIYYFVDIVRGDPLTGMECETNSERDGV